MPGSWYEVSSPRICSLLSKMQRRSRTILKSRSSAGYELLTEPAHCLLMGGLEWSPDKLNLSEQHGPVVGVQHSLTHAIHWRVGG